jgi:hypothetical protein
MELRARSFAPYIRLLALRRCATGRWVDLPRHPHCGEWRCGMSYIAKAALNFIVALIVGECIIAAISF